MNKTAIKNFAIWARNKLIAEVTYKAGLLGIMEKGITPPISQSTKDVHFFDIGTKEPYSITGTEISQRTKLAEAIQQKAKQSDYKTAYKSVIEEVAYTWFNRLIAVRFMEVNDYLPTRVRVLSSESSAKIEPDLVTSPFDADLDYSPYEKDRIMQLKNDNLLDELFRMLFIMQCNALNTILPELFEKTNDYTELLMNVSFTDKDGVVYHLVHDIPEDDFNVEKEGQVEIIGWLYQYYNTEPKDETFALLKKNVKITKERIPAATQLFTPHWIVRYMVENSLGRLWLERERASSGLSDEYLNGSYFGWKYYLEEAEQEPEVEAQLAKIRDEYKNIKPEDIKVIDPCMGSGHILVYAFDVLMQIYEICGYSRRDAAKSILENNLYGLDIDNRAHQLAYFAVMMKARQYNRRILNGGTKANVYAIQESNFIDDDLIDFIANSDASVKAALQSIRDDLHDAKEYGSILSITPVDFASLIKRIEEIHGTFYNDMFSQQLQHNAVEKMLPLIKQAYVMSQKYDVVVTNPPYMGSSGMGVKLSSFVKKNYPDSKSDLFAVFIERCGQITKKNCYQTMITQHAWMFLSSFEKLREKVLLKDTVNMAHLGARAFEEIGGEVVQTTSFVLRSSHLSGYQGSYTRLVDYGSQQEKESAFLAKQDIYTAKRENFSKIPGSPIAYWLSNIMLHPYLNEKLIRDILHLKAGLSTANNPKYQRLWSEVQVGKIGFNYSNTEQTLDGHHKWFPCNSGGEFRKWSSNNGCVIDWQFNGRNLKAQKGAALRNQDYYFREGLTWNKLSSSKLGVKYKGKGFIFDDTSRSAFGKSEDLSLYYIAGFLSTKIAFQYLQALNPTMSFTNNDLERLPIIFIQDYRSVEKLVKDNISISKTDWDSFETSWDFVRHPLLNNTTAIADAFNQWRAFTEIQFNQLKANEEELNRIFIEIYGLQNELTPDVEDKNVTIRKADLGRDIRSFISYAVGCMFGRYSLDVTGLAYAGGEWDDGKYSTFIPDKDNILPITDEEYFEDDVVGLFCAFLKKTFGADTLEENLDFIAQALGNKGNSSREVIRNYFLKDFFKDHCKTYQKRPIYWLFDSGKADGFKALIYLHRYNADTIGNLRIDYLHRMQRVYESEIARMQETIENSTNGREVTAATKRKEKLLKQLKETKEYDEKIAHLALSRIDIDLDDGVKVNYERVQTGTDGQKLEVLAKI